MTNQFSPGYPSDTPTISHGQLKQIRFVSRSHGIIRSNLGDTLDITPNQSAKQVEEFDNLTPAVRWSQFDGVTGKYSYKPSNQPMLDALLMDADPSNANVIVQTELLNHFHVVVNDRGLDGQIFQSSLVEGCIPLGPGTTSPLKEAQTANLDFNAIREKRVKGLGILYTRVLENVATRAAAPDAPTLVTAVTGGNLEPDTYYVGLAAITADGETDMGVIAGIVVPTGVSINEIDVTVPAPAGDITGYNCYAGNNQKEMRRVNGATPIITTPFTITALPATSDIPAPTNNETGPFVQVLAAAGVNGNADVDKRWPAAGPFEIVLGQAAAFVHNPSGYDQGYLLALKNGQPVDSGFHVETDGTKITIGPVAPVATDVWEFFTAYTPPSV